MSPRVAVLGGTGKTGRAVCRAVGRGAVPLGRADWDDLPGALAGCDALYMIAPNRHPDERGYIASAIDAAREAGVRRVVHHSVASPYLPAMPHHLGKARAEDVVRRSGLDWTVLQPGAYLQNFSWDGPLRIAYRADAPFGFADLDDVAAAAALVLADDVHVGATYELASVRATVADLAAEHGTRVEVVTPEEWAATDGARLEPRVREWLVAMFRHYDACGLPAGTETMRALLGRAGA